MKLPARSAALAVLSSLLALMLGVSVVAAHVTVQPTTSTTGAFQQYTVRVPTEKDVPTTAVRLEFPAGLAVSSFQPKDGWTREVERDSQQRIVGVTWSGGEIGPNEFETFNFIARNPAEPTELAWKAYQTYQGGEVVEWTGPAGSDYPASITTITPKDSVAAGTQGDQNAASGVSVTPTSDSVEAAVAPSGGSDLSLFASLGALAVSVVALILAVVSLARRPASETT